MGLLMDLVPYGIALTTHTELSGFSASEIRGVMDVSQRPQPSDLGTVLVEFLSHTISRTYGKIFGRFCGGP